MRARNIFEVTRRYQQRVAGFLKPQEHQLSSSFHKASYRAAMKPGTVIPGLDIYQDKDPPVALKRSEYPEWVDRLVEPLPSLATLRQMPEEEADDRLKMRYLKLTRRALIKRQNEERRAS